MELFLYERDLYHERVEDTDPKVANLKGVLLKLVLQTSEFLPVI